MAIFPSKDLKTFKTSLLDLAVLTADSIPKGHDECSFITINYAFSPAVALPTLRRIRFKTIVLAVLQITIKLLTYNYKRVLSIICALPALRQLRF